MMLVDQEEYEQTVSTLRKEVPASAFEAAWAEGRALTLEQAIALALEEPHDQGMHPPTSLTMAFAT